MVVEAEGICIVWFWISIISQLAGTGRSPRTWQKKPPAFATARWIRGHGSERHGLSRAGP